MMRIWHQSMTVLEDFPGYAKLMQAHAAAVCSPDTEVTLHGLAPGTYPSDVAPIEIAAVPWLHTLCSVQIVENVLLAQREGYDAVAMSCFGDPQLQALRSMVDIPVLSAFESSLLIAGTAAKSLGFLVPDEDSVKRSRARAKGYGYGERVAVIMACDPPLTEHTLDRGFNGETEFIEQLKSRVRKMAEAGAEIVIPGEGVLNSVLVHNKIAEIDGTPIFDSFGAVMCLAEMLVQLQRKTGLRNARQRGGANSTDHLMRHFRDVTISALQAAP